LSFTSTSHLALCFLLRDASLFRGPLLLGLSCFLRPQSNGSHDKLKPTLVVCVGMKRPQFRNIRLLNSTEISGMRSAFLRAHILLGLFVPQQRLPDLGRSCIARSRASSSVGSNPVASSTGCTSKSVITSRPSSS
jgi:hypothetical protein